MVTVAKVLLWGTQAGAVAWNKDRNYATFEFDEAYLEKGWNVSPLKMPIEEARGGKKIFSFPSLNAETFKGLPGLLADSLPDKFGNKLIEAWLAQQGKSAQSLNSIERLCYTGKRGMGALEYEPAIHPFKETSREIEINELVKLAKTILDERKKIKANIHDDAGKGLLEIIRVGTSAGGARAKAVIAYNEKTGEVRSGQIDNLNGFEYWIIKFDGITNNLLGDPKGYGKIEYAYSLMAKECGIQMQECKILKEHKRAHFLTKRFDRDGTEKIHMQTLCGLAHFDYNDSSAYSYEQAFQTMRQIRLPYSDAEQLYQRMVFNVIARNQDDHTKNISFLMDKSGAWRLSPAYDLTYAYDPASKWMKAHQMSVNGKREDIKKNDLIEVAKKMNIKKPKELIEKTIDTMRRWKQYAQEAEMNTAQANAIERTFLVKI